VKDGESTHLLANGDSCVDSEIMASVIRVRGSRFLHACFRDFRGVQHRKSTKMVERKKAMKVAETFERVAAGQCKHRSLPAGIYCPGDRGASSGS
jgi:hypothetical protein